MFIETPHLQLLPVAPQHLLELTEGAQWLAGLRSARGADPWVYGFVIIDGESGSVIGTCGFKGPPNGAGMVEIAYGIVPAFQGRGYATEAAQALVDFARSYSQVRIVRAHTLPNNGASARVLEKCGFLRVGEAIDPDDGLVWRFERTIRD